MYYVEWVEAESLLRFKLLFKEWVVLPNEIFARIHLLVVIF